MGRGDPSKRACKSARKKKTTLASPPRCFGVETTSDRLADGSGASHEPLGTSAAGGVTQEGSEGRGVAQGFGSSLGGVPTTWGAQDELISGSPTPAQAG